MGQSRQESRTHLDRYIALLNPVPAKGAHTRMVSEGRNYSARYGVSPQNTEAKTATREEDNGMVSYCVRFEGGVGRRGAE